MPDINEADLPSIETAKAWFTKQPELRIVVPTIVHIISNTTMNVIASDDIEAMFDSVNQDFASLDTPFVFNLTKTTNTVNDANYNCDTNEKLFQIKTRLREGSDGTLNIYMCRYPSLGVSSWPWHVNQHPIIDGIVLRALSSGYSETVIHATLTHEIGHWLGLAHTYEGHCYQDGDGVEGKIDLCASNNHEPFLLTR
jgi:hypothetical protein